MKYIYTVLFALIMGTVFASEGQPYQIYNAKGKQVTYKQMIKTLEKSDVVLFGEYHNNSLGHWLQLKVTQSLGAKRELVLGAEMFEADNQGGLTAYVTGKISEEEFSKEVRLWNNYKGDYRPLVEYAKQSNFPFIATNVPRRYASLLFKGGMEALDTLKVEEKAWIAPLPFPYDPELPGYKEMLTMFDADHVNENLPKAQAIKDATMAHFIQSNQVADKVFVHYNGSYHSNNYEGIFWYLKNYAPQLKVATITMVEADEVGNFEKLNLGLADFILVIDANILKSF
ncbi:ChaN family lipoprotein [Myroides sp. 1354]|uniref:ChaN family lipoprotein n=1 Tax=unclassified Myroides TaxID=2642485 RepID=UPI0025750832|nr:MULTISPECIES: ChaN family lipoprotein [unclassified Myroides]MDM1045497.1 ChaN family lipoprotein [Myroides sp. R163-1]MDM1056499.1 ChaN family lipoprotein [Myroides sp. 1354]MDM1069631.1 ChaN family lipoprotein [Myroides sp. 1372]